MLIRVDCTFCEPTHFDHYQCSGCGTNLGWLKPSFYTLFGRINQDKEFKFCPVCGLSFEKEKESEAK